MAAITAVGTASSWLLPNAPSLEAALRALVQSLGALSVHYSLDPRALLALLASLLAALACFAFRGQRLRFALMLAFVVTVGVGRPFLRYDELFFERKFFGLLRVEDLGGLRFITHGTTLHGIQRLDPKRRLVTTSYYHESGPIYRLTSALNQTGRIRDVAVVGLGAGVMACLLERGQAVTFFEIDPAVARVAGDPRLFTFLSDCPPRSQVVLGDARFSLAELPDASFDLIVMDAFTSDAIPIHLITREAVALYVGKLRPGGVLVFNVSNRMLDVKRVLAAIAEDAGLVAITRFDDVKTADGAKLNSEWVAMARQPADLAEVRAADRGWRPLPAADGASLWTDDYSNLLSLLR
jgi:spermidine synthase